MIAKPTQQQIRERAAQAARHAHDHHTTRAHAARLFAVPLAEVDAQYALLYPHAPRIRT